MTKSKGHPNVKQSETHTTLSNNYKSPNYSENLINIQVYFVWISKSIGSFGWFSELLKHVEQEIDFIEPQLSFHLD